MTLTHLNTPNSSYPLSVWVIIASWLHFASLTPGKQFNPSETTRQNGLKCFLLHDAISCLKKPVTRLMRILIGCPSSVIATEAKNGILPVAPRPRMPSCFLPPQYASSINIKSVNGWLSSRSFIVCWSLCLTRMLYSQKHQVSLKDLMMKFHLLIE